MGYGNMSDQKHGVAVPTRLVPFPSSISPEARASLARLVGEDDKPLNASYTMPLPEDHAGWMAIKAAADGQYAMAVKKLAGSPFPAPNFGRSLMCFEAV